MQPYDLPGLRVSLGAPRVVTEGVGHRWFPRMERLSGDHLILQHSIVADSSDLLVPGTGIHVSSDNGETWPLHYDVGEGAGIKMQQPDGSLAGPSFRFYWDPTEQPRRFRGQFVRFEDEGRRYLLEPWTVTVEGLPRDVQVRQIAAQHGQTWQAILLMHGDVIELDDEVLTTAYLTFDGDTHYTSVVVVSRDGGRTWRYRSIVAGPDSLSDAHQGPCEASMIRLSTGELMCVMRSGAGSDRPIWRAYSRDDGHTWSAVDALPAFSVDPTLCRLHNDVIVMTTGRPGIDLWFSTDPRGETWQSIDLIAHHNAQRSSPDHTITPVRSSNREERHAADQTTAYTSMVELSPNRVLLAYDRIPFGWNPVPRDSQERSRIYVLPIEVERA